MIYKFNAAIYTEGVRAFIKIPFNVWVLLVIFFNTAGGGSNGLYSNL